MFVLSWESSCRRNKPIFSSFNMVRITINVSKRIKGRRVWNHEVFKVVCKLLCSCTVATELAASDPTRKVGKFQTPRWCRLQINCRTSDTAASILFTDCDENAASCSNGWTHFSNVLRTCQLHILFLYPCPRQLRKVDGEASTWIHQWRLCSQPFDLIRPKSLEGAFLSKMLMDYNFLLPGTHCKECCQVIIVLSWWLGLGFKLLIIWSDLWVYCPRL